jgi:hypothetical protein
MAGVCAIKDSWVKIVLSAPRQGSQVCRFVEEVIQR